MVDIKINGNKYTNIERIQVATSDGMGSVKFSDASVLEGLITNTAIDEYYDTQITSIDNLNIFRNAKIGVINMPNVKSIGYQAFYGCKATEVRFEGLQEALGSCFLSMPNLVKAVFGSVLPGLGAQAFNGCSKLATLVLPYNGVATLGSSALASTAIANGNGYVYVPAAQVENYKSNSSWSAYADQIRAIEDYPDEVA